MKYRIVVNQDGLFAVQFRPSWWPFWSFHLSYVPDGYELVISTWFKRQEAEEFISRTIKEKQKDRWVEIQS